jgi:HAE1 family hydrophobic/amphiphilic exporter-1
MWISTTSIRQPVFTTMVIAAIVVFGLVAYLGLGVDLFPNVDFPIVTVTTVLPGADPQTVETDVTERLEEALNTISGIKSLRSQSSENVSIVIVEFELERDVAEAAQDVRDKVSTIRRDLPDDIDPPVIQKMDMDAAPIMAVALSGAIPIRELTEYADDVIKERLERVIGVGSVEILGGREREIRVWISMDRLSAYDLTVDDVVRALRMENLEVPGGRIETGPREIVVRTRGRIQNPDDFNRIVVMQLPTGPIYLQDVALVEDGMADERSVSRLDGERAVSLLVRRQSGTNAVAVAHDIKIALADVEANLPDEYTLVIADDTSVYIEENINDVKFHLAFGGGLAVLVIFFFLRNVTTTLISAVAIPTSIIGTFVVLDNFDFGLNMLTMLALSLSVGILIDDAIVVIENIYRHMEGGLHRREASEFATSEIGLAVMATTFSIVAVFIPVAFMEGIIGRFFYQFGITVAFAVLISLFVSFTLTPMLSSQFLTATEQHGVVYRTIEGWLNGLDRSYRSLLAWALRFRWTVVALATAFLLVSFFLVRFVGTTFLPEADESQFNIVLRAEPGWSLEATDRYVKEIESTVRLHSAVENVFTTIGGGTLEKVNQATVLVNLTEPGRREQTQAEIMNQMRAELASIQEVRVSIESVERVGGGGFRAADLQVNVRGPKTASLDELVDVADVLMAELARTPGIVDLDTTFERGKPQVSILIDRDRAADLGISAASLGSAVRLLVGGDEVTTYQEGGKQYDVRVRLVESDRDDPGRMEALPLRTRNFETVQLGNIARISHDTGPTQIDHKSRQRQITILANVEDIPLGTAVQAVNDIVARTGLPDGFVVDFEGEAEIMGEAFRNLIFALFLAVILIYMVLASQFGSFVHPLTIMLSLPMSLIGAIGALLMSGYSISIFAMIGIIMLMGLVTKNAILLIDYTITLRERDNLNRIDALLKAGPVRLRPILMTTAAMVFGMLPIALGLGAGGTQRAPMAVTVIGGLITSTMLTLVLVPVVYTLMDDLTELRLGQRLAARMGWARPPARGPAEEPQTGKG